MKLEIRAMDIAAFGKWRDRRFELTEPAVLFFGGNEAGKSTLLAFIRYMLFGSAPRKGSPDLIEPWSGLEAGGALELADGEGRLYRLERYRRIGGRGGERARIVLPDGTDGSDSAAAALLGGLTADLYRNLFAFSLRELQELSTLQSDEIGSYLFSSGLGVAPGAIQRAEKQLEAEMDKLFRPRGQNPQLNVLFRQLEQTERELSAARELSSEYNRLKRRLAECGEAIAAEEAALQRAMRQGKWLEACLSALPHWLERMKLQRLLDEAEAPEPLGSDAGADGGTGSPLPDDVDEDKIRRLAEGLPKYLSDQRELAEGRSEWEHARAELERILRQVDSAWTEEELRRFPVTIAARERVQSMRERLGAARSAWQQCCRELEMLQEERERIGVPDEATKAAAAAAEAARPGRDRPDFGAWMRVAQQLMDLTGQLRDALREREQARRLGVALADPAPGRRSRRGARASAPSSFGLHRAAMTLLWIGGTAALWLLEETIGAAVFFVVLGGVFLVTRHGRPAGEPSVDGTASLRQQLKQQMASLESGAEALRRELIAMGGSYAELPPPLAAELRDMATVDDLTPEHAERWRHLAADWLESLRQAEQERRWLEREEAGRQAKAADIAERIASLEQRMADCRRRLDEEERAWAEWKREHRLSAEVSPDSAPHLFTLAEQGLSLLAQIGKLEKRIAAAEQAMRDWSAAVTKSLRLAPGEDAAASLRRALVELDRRKAAREARLAQVNRIKELDMLLHHLAGEEGIERLEDRLRGKTEKMLADELLGAEEEIAGLQQSIKVLREERGALLNELERLSAGEEHSRLLLKRQEQKAAAEQLAERWIKRAFSLELLRMARKQAEVARQPQVVQKASAYFSELTGGRYARVIAHFHERTLEAVRADGERVQPHQLSRGTAEQLYLAIRFALAGEHARHAAVPLILDDIFVNFDANRLRHSLQLLARLSRDHQILLFTCHPHIRAAAEGHLPRLQMVELEG